MLKYFHNLVDYIFNKKLPKLCPDTSRIKYLKLKANVDWNYPYTINNTVVIPQHYMNDMVSAVAALDRPDTELWNVPRHDYSNINKQGAILCHEWIHLIQRGCINNEFLYNYFINLYENIWEFKKNTLTSYKIPNRITNPDGLNDNWIVLMNNTPYLPTLSLFNNIPTGFLISAETHSWTLIDNSASYMNRFYGLKEQLYHPNEIFAHLVSDYIILNKMYTDCWNSYTFYNTLNVFI